MSMILQAWFPAQWDLVNVTESIPEMHMLFLQCHKCKNKGEIHS